MGIIVKYTKTHRSGRVDYRRAFATSLLPFIPGKEGLQWAEHILDELLEQAFGLFGQKASPRGACVGRAKMHIQKTAKNNPLSIKLEEGSAHMMGDGIVVMMQRDPTAKRRKMQKVVLSRRDLEAMQKAHGALGVTFRSSDRPRGTDRPFNGEIDRRQNR